MKRLSSQLMLISALAGLALAREAYASPSTGPPEEMTVSQKEKCIAAQYPPLELVENDWVHCNGQEESGGTLFVYTLYRIADEGPLIDPLADRRLWGSFWAMSPLPAVPFSLKGGAGSMPATIA